MILSAKKYVAALLVFVCVCMIFSPLTAYAAEDSSQHETVKVGFFAMDGYHVIDEEGNRSGYGYDFLRLMARYWDVNYEYVGYDKSWDDMQQMLEDGEIDMVTSPRKTPEREEKFDFSRPTGTNNGILTIRSDNSTIVDGNYSTYNGMRVALLNGSSRDKDFADFAGNKGFTYSYNENGEMKGIIPDYFRRIADYAGISYEFLTPATRDEYIAYQKNKETTDISIDARLETDNYAETKKWGITAPFITMQMARVTRRDFDGKINVVATVDQTVSNSIEDAMAPGAEKLMCSTRQEMMEAVRKGKADAAFVYYYMAQAFVNSDTTGTMAYTLLEQPTFTYRMVISSTENHALAGILTKAMYAMPQYLVEDLAAQYTTYKATELTVVDWIRLHPVITVWVLLIFGCLLTTMAVIIVRLSARKKAQKAAQEKAEEMAELAERAQAANKAKTAFLSHMSHDMRTPMNAIIGFTGIAMKNDPSDEVKNCLEKIDESSEYLLSLINDVLDLTHIESGKVKYNPVPADVKNITDSALDIIKGFLTNRDINFKIQCEDAKIPNVLADPARLRDVLVNILSNAVKFTPDGGTITFEAQCQEKGGDGYINMRYRISDTGIGMSEEFIKEVFEEFAQEDSDVRTQYHGVGLGMAIVKKYVDMMGGTISVQSKKHEGTTFTVDIPLEITDKEWNKSDPVFSEKVDLTGVNVLLAEDNELNAEIAAVQLEEFGMNVERAVDGKNAVEVFRNHPKGTFDVILMDVMMPEMNGYEATKAIRAMNDRPDGKNIPIIAMTANSFAEDVQASLDAGMNAHLSKPIVMDEVIKTILRYVR